jgi:hypothetical protein
MTKAEARKILEDVKPDNQPLVRGYDPYNSADHDWWRWLMALRTMA